MNIEDMWQSCSWAYRISTCGFNWWKFSRLIEKALSWSQWRRTLASWTPTWSLFHVSIISSKHFIKSSLCSNTFEIILLWKFVCTDQGILMATQSSRHDTLCGEQEKNTENAFRFAKKTLTLVTKIDWVGIAMNIMSIGICSFYFPVNTSRFAPINWCTIIKLCNTFLFVMSPRKNERLSTIESSVEQAELKILRNVTVSLAITKDQEMLCQCCFATA